MRRSLKSATIPKAKDPRPASARFIPPMQLLRTDALPNDPRWLYELKLDGYRAIAFKRDGKLYLRSRNDKDFSIRSPASSRDSRSCRITP